MKFAENNRISHRQLFRQIVLAFLAPFLLCLFGERKLLGLSGIGGTLAAVILLLFYVIFLIRLAPYYEDLPKAAGKFWGRAIGIFFAVYVVLTGAYLLSLLETIVPKSLVEGVPGKWISFFAILVCSIGTHKGMQRRGRAAEVTGGVLLFGIVIMMVLCVGQGKGSYLMDMVQDSGFTGSNFIRSTYGVLCGFAGIGLLPFSLEYVQKQGSSRRSAALAILILGVILVIMQLLLPAVFGWDRLRTEKYPVIPLLAGANLPGNVLARFDVVWMGFLLYSLLFAIGSLLHYGNQIMAKAGLGTGRFWMAVVIYLLSIWSFHGVGIEDYFGNYLAYIFVPGMLLIQIFLLFSGRERLKRRTAQAGSIAGVLILCMLLTGCGGVEPEKRLYPLALGMDSSREGFTLTYGTPDLPQATGQDKAGEDAGGEALAITGKDFKEIEEIYNHTQEKYLDMGHLQILILGQELISTNQWKKALDYLEQEPFVGENVYVFQTEEISQVMKWQGPQGTSVGEYLQGVMENRESGMLKGVTLRELYYEKYKSGMLPEIPQVKIQDDQIIIL